MNLSTLHQLLGSDEKEDLATKAGSSAGYLWQLATGWRGKRPSLQLIQALAAADKRLTVGEMVDEFAPHTKAHAA